MLFLATSFLSFGRHILVLVVGRTFQGFSAALVWTSGLALLTDVFGQQRYGEAVGYTQTALSVGTTAAPLLGGLVYSQGGYSAVCAMSMGTVAISVVLAVTMIEPPAKAGWEEPAASTPECSVVGNTNQNTTSLNGGIMAQDHKVYTRLIDEGSALLPEGSGEGGRAYRPAYFLLLRSERILAAMWGIFTFAFVMISFEAMIPLFVKDLFHWDPKRAALIFLCWIIPGFLGPVAGKAADRWKSPWIPIGGFLFTVPPLLLMRFVTEDNTVHKVLLCLLLALVGECSPLPFPFTPFFRF
jgi:predicted MFS family arabinose efflux permease